MTFRYRIVKKSVGSSPYTTRPELGVPLTEAEVIQEMEAATSVTGGDVKNALTTLRRILLSAALSGRPSEVLFDLFRVSLASGGAIDDPEQLLRADDIQPRMTIHWAASVQRQFRGNVTLERVGIARERAPQIDVVRNLATENLDTYMPGNVLRISGQNLKVDKGDLNQGVFFRDEEGAEIRMTQYIDNWAKTLTVMLPGTLSGSQQLIVRAKYGQNLRETIYSTLLEQEN